MGALLRRTGFCSFCAALNTSRTTRRQETGRPSANRAITRMDNVDVTIDQQPSSVVCPELVICLLQRLPVPTVHARLSSRYKCTEAVQHLHTVQKQPRQKQQLQK
ncbi:Protein of unknown function [Gryllus bimaculatus]|nr:Protein of unknown function [Gryllus bimaculatus]